MPSVRHESVYEPVTDSARVGKGFAAPAPRNRPEAQPAPRRSRLELWLRRLLGVPAEKRGRTK